jgi:heme-degrading monooxygenase HmoA
VIVRVWRAKIVPERVGEYRRFEREQCLPTLRKQPGFLGVLFLREGGTCAASVTVWEDRGVVDALESSPSYRRTIRELVDGGLLAGEQAVETFEVVGGDLRPEPLMLAVGAADIGPSRKEAAP